MQREPELLLHGRLRFPQTYVDANDWAVDVDAEILILRLRQVGIGANANVDVRKTHSVVLPAKGRVT